MITGDSRIKIAVREPVLVELLDRNYDPEPQERIVINDTIPDHQLVYWELGVISVAPVRNMYKIFCIAEPTPATIISNVLNNLYNRGLFSLINPRGADGSMRCSQANLRAWRNRIATDKAIDGSVNLFIFNGDNRDATAAVLFAMSIVDIGGSACIKVGNVHTTSLASAIYAFAGYFTACIHRVCNGDIYLIGLEKAKTLRAETMFTLATCPQDTSLYMADYMRGDDFSDAITTMTNPPKLPSVETWKRLYKYEYSHFG